MRCAVCQAENREGRRFCGACGVPLARICPDCDFANQADDRFCGGCGKPLEPAAGTPVSDAPAQSAGAGERRQVTVLFADLAGYTEFGRRLDAEEVHALLERFFERVDGIVMHFGGAIDKHIGDCVMAVFGAPLAHDNDAERAARAALAIREAMAELSDELGRALDVHIGLAAGQVVASPTGSAAHREYTVTGDSVNLASRLTDAAPGGTILISDLVRRMLPSRFACRAVETLAVKGLVEPVQAWRLLNVDDAEAARPPFVGRQAELAQFQAVLRACRETGTGRAVVVRGEAGIGKTHLVEEFEAHAAAAGFACHIALVLDFGAGIGQDAICTLVRSLLGLRPGTARMQPVAAQALERDLVGDDQQVYLNDLLDLPQPTALRALYDAMDNAARNRGKRSTVASLVSALSGRRPLLLVIEDVQWADRLVLEHLVTLTETVAACPALLVMTTRIEGDPLDHAWRSRTAGSPLLTIDLGPLRPQEATALAGAYLDASGAFARRCIERAAGNPLFLEQLLRHAETSAGAGVPGSVQSLVQARLDQLEAADKQALQAAAVFGQRFALSALRHLLDDPAYDCAPLVRRFLVRPVGDDFLFAHALIRDAVYDSLLRARRRALHLRAAAWFADSDLVLQAEHLERAEDPSAPQAYLAAARARAADYHYERARALTESGLAIATNPAARFALTCLQGEILHDLGAMAEARAAYERALEAAADDGQRAHAWLGLAAVKRVTEDLDGAFADLDRAQAAAERDGLTEQRARIHFLRGNLYFPRGQIQACLMEHQKSLEFARTAASAELEAAALGGLGDAEYVRGHLLTARRYFERSVELCRQHGFGRIEVASLPMAAIGRYYAGELPGACADALAALAAAERVGHHRAAIISCHIVFFAAMSQAELDVASQHVERAIDLSRQLGAKRFEAEGLWFRAEVLSAQGRHAEALSTVRQALKMSTAAGMAFVGPSILGGLARITNDPQERQAALAEAEQLLASGSLSHNYLWFYQFAIDTALDGRDWDNAMRYAQALADYTRAEPLPLIDIIIDRARALAALGRDGCDPQIVQNLASIRERAEKIGWRALVPGLDAALAAARSDAIA